MLLAMLFSMRVAFSQAGNGITAPAHSSEISGQVAIEGTATSENFARYELAFFKEFAPQADWTVFYTGHQPVVNGLLAIWDTTVGMDTATPFYPDGTYRLRLRVVRQDGNYDEYFALSLQIRNSGPTSTPTATETATPSGEATQVSTPVLLITELPTLTPFPTATPQPSQRETIVAIAPDSDGTDIINIGEGFQLEGTFDTTKIKNGALTGVRIALVFFLLLLAYQFLRKGVVMAIARLTKRQE
ncbi:MAG: hypothetical protein ABFQ89_02950 [Chloroflexota bacterium]